MNKLLKLIALSPLFFTAIVFAESPHYAIVVDAGSTGSRLHLYQYEQNDTQAVSIKEIFSEKTKPGLSAYQAHPEQAGQSLKQLCDDAVTQLNALHVDKKDVSMAVLGTAGMRILPEQAQRDIYAGVRNYVSQNYGFTLGDIQTIPGAMEGVYAWLDVNYLEGNFVQGKQTLGVIDMGGASTQIAFETRDYSKPDDEMTVKVNNQSYTLFSKSFLGLGLNESRKTMNQSPNASHCYPSGYVNNTTQSNQYNFKDCSDAYANVIDQYQIDKALIPFKNTQFAVFSGAYYVYNFFGVEDASQGALEARVNNICNMSWDDMKKEYQDSHVSEDMLSSYCANGIYLDNLFYKTYHLSYSQMWVTDRARSGQEIDWALGALLYKLG